MFTIVCVFLIIKKRFIMGMKNSVDLDWLASQLTGQDLHCFEGGLEFLMK